MGWAERHAARRPVRGSHPTPSRLDVVGQGGGSPVPMPGIVQVRGLDDAGSLHAHRHKIWSHNPLCDSRAMRPGEGAAWPRWKHRTPAACTYIALGPLGHLFPKHLHAGAGSDATVVLLDDDIPANGGGEGISNSAAASAHEKSAVSDASARNHVWDSGWSWPAGQRIAHRGIQRQRCQRCHAVPPDAPAVTGDNED